MDMDRVKNLSRHAAGIVMLCAIACIPCTLILAQQKKGANNTAPGQGMTTDIPGALPGIRLISPVPNGQWTLPAGDYANTRFSPLSQINTTNVQNLQDGQHVFGRDSKRV